MDNRVILGMSGGVDSSVAAYLLQKQGYEVIGVTLDLHSFCSRQGDIFEVSSPSCLTKQDGDDAVSVAQSLNIDYHVYDYSGLFKEKVINYFIDEYLNGRTPNPCVFCNRNIKFELLLKLADHFNAKYIATGHYAKIVYNNDANRYFLMRSPAAKDQSYVLYKLTQEQLSRTLFPLGDYNKSDIRMIASQLGLDTASKPDSQEICFIPDHVNYADYIDDYIGRPVQPGNFIDSSGNILGRHKGITRYTVGQRKGLGVTFGKPMFVLKIIPETNEIVLGESGQEYSLTLTADSINLVALDKITAPISCAAKVRYAAAPSPCTVYPIKDGKLKVEFSEPQRAVTPGQSVVFYNGDIVLGGGRIICAE